MRVKEQLMGHCEQMLKAFVHQTRSVLQTLSLEQQKERGKKSFESKMQYLH